MSDLQQIVMSVPGVVIGFAFHEYAHAQVATWFGDDTPRLQGRLTLNPLAHLDPIGTLLLLLAGFGWAKPVMVNTARLRPRILGDIAVSLAGVAMNFILAVIFLLLYTMANRGMLGWSHPVLSGTFWLAMTMNIILVGFNLLPIPPLDGFRVAQYLLPAGSHELVHNLYRFGPLLLIILFATDILDLAPVYNAIYRAVTFVAWPIGRLL
ncbi:Zn-dependent protease [Symbiobacterium terraclitae]|uniref:Zn-dependent protease n=1 Tax=Symbiobacterium terraclitae TaxID=557451 RepID=A0ABS4JMG6_9FIRM|nr:site-2 protease family protein [Symbiobacterium terraclitae]MBP2016734.1 Zn-dependent protease [Symbiobacterium terraclitae]